MENSVENVKNLAAGTVWAGSGEIMGNVTQQLFRGKGRKRQEKDGKTGLKRGMLELVVWI